MDWYDHCDYKLYSIGLLYSTSKFYFQLYVQYILVFGILNSTFMFARITVFMTHVTVLTTMQAYHRCSVVCRSPQSNHEIFRLRFNARLRQLCAYLAICCIRPDFCLLKASYLSFIIEFFVVLLVDFVPDPVILVWYPGLAEIHWV